MADETASSVTQLLQAWRGGDGEAYEHLWPLVYDELRKMAGQYLRKERPDHTLQPTALVNEAYLRLIDQRQAQWKDRNHFFAIAAKIMRRILVDYARQQRSAKRGGGSRKLPIEIALDIEEPVDSDVVAIDAALKKLASIDEDKALIVELKFFGGLSSREVAEMRGCSLKTVQRHWSIAKMWLYRELQG
jgi:RNA polymerase sigma factor (TIGR02999 family)